MRTTADVIITRSNRVPVVAVREMMIVVRLSVCMFVCIFCMYIMFTSKCIEELFFYPITYLIPGLVRLKWGFLKQQ